MRVVIDTNVWVSALLNPHGFPARILQAFIDRQFEAVVSHALLTELRSVLSRPRILRKYQISEEDVNEYLSLIEQQSILVETLGSFRLCRDPHDDFLIETALRGSAAYIVTRDDDLKSDTGLLSQDLEGVKIVSVQQFVGILSQQT